jgi:hypothetical protein
MRRTLQAADIAGIRALVVHAKDEKAGGSTSTLTLTHRRKDPLHLSIKEIRRLAMDTL